MKVIKQIDEKTRIIQAGRVPNVRIELQRKKWYGWSRVNCVGTGYCDTIDQYEMVLLADEKRRKEPFYGNIVHKEQF